MDKEEYIPSDKEMEIIAKTRRHIQDWIKPARMEIIDIVRHSDLQELEKEEIIEKVRNIHHASHIPTELEMNYRINKAEQRLQELEEKE